MMNVFDIHSLLKKKMMPALCFIPSERSQDVFAKSEYPAQNLRY